MEGLVMKLIKKLWNRYINWLFTEHEKRQIQQTKSVGLCSKKFEDAKLMNMFKSFRKEVEIGANGTQKYMVKEGKNKGKIL